MTKILLLVFSLNNPVTGMFTTSTTNFEKVELKTTIEFTSMSACIAAKDIMIQQFEEKSSEFLKAKRQARKSMECVEFPK